jgi:hypothetical protein
MVPVMNSAEAPIGDTILGSTTRKRTKVSKDKSKEDKINRCAPDKRPGNAIMEAQSEILEDDGKYWAVATYLLRMLFTVRNEVEA